MTNTFLVKDKKHGNVWDVKFADKSLLDTGKHGNMLLCDLSKANLCKSVETRKTLVMQIGEIMNFVY